MSEITTRAEEGAKLYVLMKRGLYWRPDAQGYTGVLADAGRYTAEKAAAYTRHDDPSVTAILASEADEFSPACWEETKLARRDKQLADAEAFASALRDRVAVLESENARLRKFGQFVLLWCDRGPPHGGPGNEAAALDVIRHHPALSQMRTGGSDV